MIRLPKSSLYLIPKSLYGETVAKIYDTISTRIMYSYNMGQVLCLPVDSRIRRPAVCLYDTTLRDMPENKLLQHFFGFVCYYFNDAILRRLFDYACDPDLSLDFRSIAGLMG